MDNHTEPMRLEDQACKQMNSIVRDICDNWIKELQIAAENGEDNLKRKKDSVTSESQELRVLLSGIPYTLVGELVVVDSLKYFTSRISTFDEKRRPSIQTPEEEELHTEVCISMFKAVMLPCLNKYEVKNVKSEFVQDLLLGLMYIVPNIMFLDLPAGRNTMHHVLNSIPMLTELREFHYRFECTNLVIIKIVEYCPNINTIDVQYSHVNDVCLSEFFKCEYLIDINVSDTSITEVGYATLLSNLQLSKIVWFKPIDGVLLHVEELPHVKTFIGTFLNPIPLTQKCPNITHLNILTATVSVSNLQDLIFVEDMKVYQTSYIKSNLETYLHSLGYKLTVLEFHLVAFVAIDTVVNVCISLKKLEFSYCHVTLSEDDTLNSGSEHFRSVTDLTVKGGNWDAFDFMSILHLYVYLESFVVTRVESVDDDSIQDVLMKGGLRNLKEFTSENCGNMAIRTAFNLIFLSRNLTKLGNIDSWTWLSEASIASIEGVIRVNNLALEIIR